MPGRASTRGGAYLVYPGIPKLLPREPIEQPDVRARRLGRLFSDGVFVKS